MRITLQARHYDNSYDLVEAVQEFNMRICLGIFN